jgi:bis(5'-adenosyl)-triphosphatase
MSYSPNQSDVNCLFCQNDIVEKYFFAKGNFVAIYNIAPVLPGHSLIIPLKHFETIDELSDSELGEMMIFARKVTSMLKKVFNCDGFDWTVQDGVSAGQTIPHLHLHIIPRKPNDLAGAGEWYSHIPENEKQLIDSDLRKRLEEEEYMAITLRLREEFLNLK